MTRIFLANNETETVYLTSRPVRLRDCGKGPTKLLFSRFLRRSNEKILLCVNMVMYKLLLDLNVYLQETKFLQLSQCFRN